MRVAAVPEQKDGRGDPAQQVPDKANHLATGDGAGDQMEVRMRVGVTAEIADSLGQLKQWRRIGACPRGDRVRQAVGSSENPLSSTKTSVAFRRRAFF